MIVLPEHIGEVYRPYIIVGIADHRDKYNHKLYLAHCMFCDTVVPMRLVDLKMLNGSTKFRCYSDHLHNNICNRELQNIFSHMRSRCYDRDSKDYKFWGGKNVRICNEWLMNPSLFEKWAFDNGYQEGLSIDRIDSHGDYCPENCRWIPMVENSRFKSTTKVIEVDGICYTGRQWAEYLGIGTNTINSLRRDYGEEVVKELIKRMLDRRPNTEVIRQSGKTWLDAYGINPKTVPTTV